MVLKQEMKFRSIMLNDNYANSFFGICVIGSTVCKNNNMRIGKRALEKTSKVRKTVQ